MMNVPFDLDAHRAPQIGLIVLQTDETIERDMKRLLPEEVELLVSRVPSGAHVTLESLGAMEAELTHAAHLFPQSAAFAAVGYGCTSGSAQIGVDRVATAIQAEVDTDQITQPVSALINACRHLGVTRIALLSPYIQSVSVKLCAVLEEAGITVSAFASFNESIEEKVVRIAPASIIEAVLKLEATCDVDAVFISCTNLRTLDTINTLEAAMQKPVLTSNQVLAWDLMRIAKVDHKGRNAGTLWSR